MMTTSWKARQGLRAEKRPEFDDGSAPAGPDLTYGEVAVLAHRRAAVLALAQRTERQGLARARRRLVRAAARTHHRPAPVRRSPAPGPTPEPGYASVLTLSPWLVGGLALVVVVVEFLFWWTLARQFVRIDDYTSPAAWQAVALALLFPAVVLGGARIGAAVGHLVGLPAGVARTWHRTRAWFGVVVVVAMSVAMGLTAHARFSSESAEVAAVPLPVLPLALAFVIVPLLTLAVHAFAVHPVEELRRRSAARDASQWEQEVRDVRSERLDLQEWHLAAVDLEARIRRISQKYALEIARGEAGLLADRARRGPVTAVLPADTAGPDTPQTWLGLPLLPVRRAVTVSEEVLRDYRPPALRTDAATTAPGPLVAAPELTG